MILAISGPKPALPCSSAAPPRSTTSPTLPTRPNLVSSAIRVANRRCRSATRLTGQRCPSGVGGRTRRRQGDDSYEQVMKLNVLPKVQAQVAVKGYACATPGPPPRRLRRVANQADGAPAVIGAPAAARRGEPVVGMVGAGQL